MFGSYVAIFWNRCRSRSLPIVEDRRVWLLVADVGGVFFWGVFLAARLWVCVCVCVGGWLKAAQNLWAGRRSRRRSDRERNNFHKEYRARVRGRPGPEHRKSTRPGFRSAPLMAGLRRQVVQGWRWIMDTGKVCTNDTTKCRDDQTKWSKGIGHFSKIYIL